MATVVEGGNLLEVIENYVKTHKIMIFSKSWCPYCDKVKELLKSLGVEFFALELDKLENGAELQKAMAQKAGRSSVPQVYINEQHIGGCDDTMAAHKSGKLQALL